MFSPKREARNRVYLRIKEGSCRPFVRHPVEDPDPSEADRYQLLIGAGIAGRRESDGIVLRHGTDGGKEVTDGLRDVRDEGADRPAVQRGANEVTISRSVGELSTDSK